MGFCFPTVNSLMVCISTGNQLYFIRSRPYLWSMWFRFSISKTVLWWLGVANMFLSRIFHRNWQRKSVCSIWGNNGKLDRHSYLPTKCILQCTGIGSFNPPVNWMAPFSSDPSTQCYSSKNRPSFINCLTKTIFISLLKYFKI